MSKTAPLPVQSKKPTIRFVPKLRQYETGIDYVRVDGFRDKITLEGYTAPTMEDQTRILRMMEKDAFCGITTWENREMPAEQKRAEGDLRASQAQNAAMKVEMDAMREELNRLTALTKKPAGGE